MRQSAVRGFFNGLKLGVLLFFCIAAIAIRLRWIFLCPYAYLDTDMGTVGLMARHILQGKFPMFFYGQYYLAPVESCLTALSFLIFGSGPVSLVLAPILVMASTGIVLYFLGTEFKNKEVGLWAMLWFLFPSLELFLRSFKTQGYIPEYLCAGGIILLLALKILSSQRKLYYFLLGIVSGIGFWITGLTAYFIVAAGIFLLMNMKRSRIVRYGFIWVAAFFVSGLPYWLFSIKHNFCTFAFGREDIANLGELLRKFLEFDLKTFISLGMGTKLDLLVGFIYGLILLSFIAYTFLKKERNIWLLWLLLVTTLFFYTRPGVYGLAMRGTVRYISSLYIFISLMVGYSGWWLNKKIRYGGALLISILLCLNVFSVFRNITFGRMRSLEMQTNFEKITTFLTEKGIYNFIIHNRRLRSLVFFSNERIISREIGGTNYIGYDDIVERAEKVAYFATGIESAIKGVSKDFEQGEGFYYNVSRSLYRYREILPDNFIVHSNYNDTGCRYAIDRDYSNWWSSVEPRNKGMYFQIDLAKVHKIAKLQFFYGDHYVNMPNICRVSLSLDGKEWREVLRIEYPQPFFWSGPRLYWHVYDGRCELIFEPQEARYIRIIEDGSDEINPWDINELFVYEHIAEDLTGWDKDDLYKAYNFLLEKGVKFIYSDFWESSKIREWGKGQVNALRPFNKNYLNPEDSSRLIRWKDKMGFIVLEDNRMGWERLIEELNIRLSKENFGRYWCYWFSNLEEIKKVVGMYWIGIGGVNYLNPVNLKVYKKVEFANGITFLGLGMDKDCVSPGSSLAIDYYWQLKKRPSKNLAVFVHFLKDKEVIFQGDHNFLVQYPIGLKINPEYIFREHYSLVIPKNIPAGVYKIVIGLWLPGKGGRISITDTKRTTAEIGEIKITE